MILYWSELVTWGKRELKLARENHGRMNFGWRLLNNQNIQKRKRGFVQLFNWNKKLSTMSKKNKSGEEKRTFQEKVRIFVFCDEINSVGSRPAKCRTL